MATLIKNIMEKFPTLLDLQGKHGSKLSYGLVTLLTAGGECIFSTAVFQCPCHPTCNLPYGMVFLLVPALALFLLGYVLNTCICCMTAGCCRQDCSQKYTCGSQSCKEFLWISTTAVVAPLTQVAVGLLEGTFYECSASGIPSLARRMCLGSKDNCPTLMPKLPCLQNLELDLQDLLKVLQAQSQVAGWILIALVCIFLMISTSITYCRSPVSFMKLKFSTKYVIEEQKSLIKKKAERMQLNLQMRMLNIFLRAHIHTTGLQVLKTGGDLKLEISPLYTLNSKEQYYSMLHKHVDKVKKSKNEKDKGDKKDTEEGKKVAFL